MLTWNDILETLQNVDKDRLTDPAIILIDCDGVAFDLLEFDANELGEGETRLIAIPLSEI